MSDDDQVKRTQRSSVKRISGGMAAFVGVLVCCTSCSRENSHSVSEIARAWADLCLSNGPTPKNAELIAKTFSLQAQDEKDLNDRKVFVEKQHALAALAPAESSVSEYPQKMESWWFDKERNSAVTYVSNVVVTQPPRLPPSSETCPKGHVVPGCVLRSTYRAGTDNVDSCEVSADLDNAEMAEAAIEYVQSLKPDSLRRLVSVDTAANDKGDGTEMLITGEKLGTKVEINLRDQRYNQELKTAILNGDIGWFKKRHRAFTAASGTMAEYFKGPVRVWFTASTRKSMNSQLCTLDLLSRTYRCAPAQ
jgi:hypothetical protein